MYKLLLLATFLGGTFGDHDSDHQGELPSACRMSPDTSDCGGAEQRWFFYKDLNMCTEFTYKGCGKSENNFASREDCEKLCLEKTETKTPDKTAISIPADQSVNKVEETVESTTDNQEQKAKADKAGENTKPDNLETSASDTMDVEGIDEDEEEMQEKLKEREAIQKRFNMANSDDLLTLEEYIQDDNIDVADILDAAEAGEITDEDIRANLYTGDEEDESEFVDAETEADEKEKEQDKDLDDLPKGDTTVDDVNKAENQNENKPEKEDTSDESYLQEQVEEEGELQERFNMADSGDMLALQEIMQEPGMEMGDVEKQDTSEKQLEDKKQSDQKENADTLAVDIEGDLGDDYSDRDLPDITIDIDASDMGQQEDNLQTDLYYSDQDEADQDEDVAEAEQMRQQFSMADDDDYVTLEDLMANPNMEIVESENDYTSTDGHEMTHIYYDNNEMNNGDKADTVEKEVQNNGDTYGEHLDYNHSETPKDEEEDEINETLNFETELEQKFNMADREDILSLEEILQDPNTEVGEVVSSKDAGESQDGDVKGVLSLAASFLGDNNNEEKEHLKKLQDDMQHLPEIARKPFEEANEEIHRDFNDGSAASAVKETVDYTHPAELLKRQQMKEDQQPPQPPINIQSMAHDDKMMLMSLLHVDRLKFHRLEQTTPSLLDIVKEEREKKLQNQVSPTEDVIGMISKKEGVKKYCLYHKDPGPCQEKTLQWHYDPVLLTCLPFFYGGCEGNDNRFDTIGECLRKCSLNDQKAEKSLPEPIPEPPTFSKDLSSKNRFKTVISKMLPGKILSLRERMSPGQQKFIHKFIKSAIGHVTDIKPLNIAQIPLGIGKYKVHEKMIDKRNRLPMPIKSILFKWPILRMVFDRTIKEIKPMHEMGDMSDPMDNVLPVFPKEVKEFRHFEKDWGKNGRGEANGFRKMGRERNEFRNVKKFDRFNRDDFGEFKKMGRFWGRDNEEPKGRRSRHFSPSFKKSYKMMNLNEDKRHQISSDPKNKVNLIQVFVNKPHTESHANPSHHHTMIKKEYSPVIEPQVDPPMPPAPPPASHQSYPGYPPNSQPHQQFYNRPFPPPAPSSRPHSIPPQMNHNAPFPPKPFFPQNHPHMPHGFPPHPLNHHYHAAHPHYHVHEHVHPLPMIPAARYGPHALPPPFIQPITPWWARFGKPYFEPPRRPETGMRIDERQSQVIPSTDYPEEKTEEEYKAEEQVSDETEEVLEVNEPGQDEGPHYSCLLPVSTGVCKAFEERYYFNKATGSCELFIYGGCGGNANNYLRKKECIKTCSSKGTEESEDDETSTLPDDTVIVTSPVYVPAEAESTVMEDTTQTPEVKEEVGKDGKQPAESDIVEELQEKDDEHTDVKVERMQLFKSSNTEYIIIISVMCFVGLSAVVLVALAIANLSRRLSKTKKEKVIEAVLSSHLDTRSSGSVTPSRMSYYGQPPSELGPPPINEVLKLHHKDKGDEEM